LEIPSCIIRTQILNYDKEKKREIKLLSLKFVLSEITLVFIAILLFRPKRQK